MLLRGTGSLKELDNRMSYSTVSSEEPVRTLIDELLEEQGALTAVERFSQRHEACEIPTQAQFYKDLLPAREPGPGQQFAFSVDLDKCSACKGCVTACHNLNGLEEEETWRSVGTIVGEVAGMSEQKTVTTACHHCVDPGCMNGCPVLAYEKDEVTGIVRHLDDQCIGCEYCVMKCPYEVPQYSESKGIVRKCDMCYSRLAEGEAPACVQACPNEAIAISIVDQGEILESTSIGDEVVAGAPDSTITVPTTQFQSDVETETFSPVDQWVVEPSKAHVPLELMLVMTQWGVGGFILAGLLMLNAANSKLAGWVDGFSFGIFGLGLAASVLHLGQPLKAWRVFLGWRKSWLSREAMAFGAFLLPGMLAALASVTVVHPTLINVEWIQSIAESSASLLRWSAALVGAFAVWCSVMVYVDTKKEVWSMGRVTWRFIGSSVVGMAQIGLCAFSIGTLVHGVSGQLIMWVLSIAAVLANALKLFYEASDLIRVNDADWNVFRKVAVLYSGVLSKWWNARLALTVIGGCALPLLGAVAASTSYGVLSLFIFSLGAVLNLLGELAERHLFFVSSPAPKMPGAIVS